MPRGRPRRNSAFAIPAPVAEPPVGQGPHRPDLTIDWRIPEPRPGWRGPVDRFFGPGQTRPEILVQVMGIPVLGMLVAVSLGSGDPGLSWPATTLLALFVVDAVGGVLTNATGSAKRWYHRPGTRAERLGFVGLHLVHLVLLALVVPGIGVTWLLLNAAVLTLFAGIIEFSPLSIRRPVAMGLFLAAVLLNQVATPLPDGLGWIPLVLYLKLLVCHLLPEAPFSDGPAPAREANRPAPQGHRPIQATTRKGR